MNLTSCTTIGKYEIVSQLGAGGMGSVYLAHDPGLDREVAIKVLRAAVADDELRARFLREARATANLHHVNIVTIYEVGQHDQQPFIAMEYVPGHSLATVIAEQRPIPLATKLYYLEQLCAGLDFAHRAGIVHRDIKPANLMVDGRGVVRILDFGIARLDGSGMTMDGALIGTINYMSPEQMLGRRVDHRSDIFAAGAVAYELISYCQAFPGTLDQLIHRLPNEPPAALRSLCPDLDPDLEDIVTQALEKDPSRRFGDLSQMQAALAAARERIETARGPAFIVPTPAATAALVSTLRVRPSAPARDDDEVKAQLKAASKCLDTGDPARAAELAQRVIERIPSSVEAHALLVRAHRAMASARERGASGVTPAPRWRKVALAATGVGLAGVAAVVAGMMGAFTGEKTMTSGAPITPSSVTRPEAPPVTTPAAASPAPAAPPSAAPAPATAANDAALETAAHDIMLQVDRARLAAMRAKARELAAEQFAAASASADAARRAHARGDYIDAAGMGTTAARQFTEAIAEAGREAERRQIAAAKPPSPPLSPSSATGRPDETIPTSAPASNSSPDPATPAANPPAAPPAAESSTAVATVNPIVRERPGILATLEKYRSAHQTRNIAVLKTIYPTLAGEDLQAKERAFKDKRVCRELDIQFGEPVISLTADASVAHVNVMSTYICTPVTGQPKPQQPLPDVFQMRKQGDAWVIAVMGAMGR